MPHWDPFWPLDESDMDEEAIVFSSVPVDENPRRTPPRRERSKGLTLDDIEFDKVDWPGWQNRPWDLSILRDQKGRMPPTPPEETSYKDVQKKLLSNLPSINTNQPAAHSCNMQSTPCKGQQQHPISPLRHYPRGHSPTDSCCSDTSFSPDIQMPCQHLRMEKAACHGCGKVHCGSCPECLMEWFEEQTTHRRRSRRHSLLRECHYGEDS